jgi:hypothetical protein
MGEPAHRCENVAVQLSEQLVPAARLFRSERQQPRTELLAPPAPHRRDLGVGQLIDEEINRAVADLSHRLLR